MLLKRGSVTCFTTHHAQARLTCKQATLAYLFIRLQPNADTLSVVVVKDREALDTQNFEAMVASHKTETFTDILKKISMHTSVRLFTYVGPWTASRGNSNACALRLKQHSGELRAFKDENYANCTFLHVRRCASPTIARENPAKISRESRANLVSIS